MLQLGLHAREMRAVYAGELTNVRSDIFFLVSFFFLNRINFCIILFNLIIDHQIGSIIKISQELRPLAETNNIRTIEKISYFLPKL